jgi:hypothetical protein
VDILKCYEVLDIPPHSSAEKVREAYVQLAHVWHPDRYLNNPVLHLKATEHMRKIDEAYATFRQFMPELQNQGEALPEPVNVREAGEIDTHSHADPGRHYGRLTVFLIALLIAATTALGLYLFRHEAGHVSRIDIIE